MDFEIVSNVDKNFYCLGVVKKMDFFKFIVRQLDVIIQNLNPPAYCATQ